MLKGIDPRISPDLLYTLALMGHGDELVIVDRNYPAYSGPDRVHRLDGVDAVTAARAVLTLLPLDTFIDSPVERMEPVGEPGLVTSVQEEFHAVAQLAAGRRFPLGSVDRTAFYERARSAFAVLATGEDRPYGCFILTKGVLPEFAPAAG